MGTFYKRSSFNEGSLNLQKADKTQKMLDKANQSLDDWIIRSLMCIRLGESGGFPGARPSARDPRGRIIHQPILARGGMINEQEEFSNR